MEHVINAKLRNLAFWKFMVFFLITIVIVVTAIYFDYELPHKENAMLRTEVAHYQKDSMSQQEFIRDLGEIKNLIDSLGKVGADNGYLTSLINNKLTEINKSQNQNSGDRTVFDRLILDVFLSYKNAKSQNISLGNANKTIEELNRRLTESENRRDQYLQQLNFDRGTNRQ
jgi:hypothetical protein